jgi:hypothetical protein
LREARDGDIEVVIIIFADMSDEVGSVNEAAFNSLPLILSGRGIAS